jgi:hypothetical protein
VSNPVFTTLAPVRFATLAAGPYAALLAGAPLYLHAPFDARSFVSEFEACGPAHLVAPRALAEALAASGGAWRLASLILSGSGVAGLPPIDNGGALVDLDGLSELARATIAPMMAAEPEKIARRA